MLQDALLNEKRHLRIALAVCLTLSVILIASNLLLQRENARLRLHNENLSSADGPVIGSHISSLEGDDLSKHKIKLDLKHQSNPTLLLVFSPTCRYCKANLPTWLHILQNAPSVNTVYVDLAGTANQAYFSQSKLPSRGIPIHLVPEESILHNLKVTPTTVVLDRNGIVKGSWAGVLSPSQQNQLESLLGKS